ncbi:MAG TPA: hypothetical protein VM223_01260 [Planctomycetota bacterium]|nr:hypothetical protein [Planctomycetota bacterium]
MKNTGGAFPYVVPNYGCTFNRGMSLRAYLAGQAISGVAPLSRDKSPEKLADFAVLVADATIARLKHKP